MLSADPGIAWLLSRVHSRNYQRVPILGQSCLATKISAPEPSNFGWFRHNQRGRAVPARAKARPGAARALLAACGGRSRVGRWWRGSVLAPVAQEPEGKGVGEDEGVASELIAGLI